MNNIDDAQFDELLKQHDIKPQPVTDGSDPWSDFGPSAPVEPQGMQRVTESIGDNIKDQAIGGLKKIKTSITGGADRMQEGVDQGGVVGAAKFGRAALETGLGAAAGAAQTIFSPLGGVVETGIQGLSEGAKVLDDVTGNVMSDKIKELDQSHPEVLGKVKDLIAKHPQLATDAMDLLSIIGLKGGASVAEQPFKKVVSETVASTKGVTKDIIDAGADYMSKRGAVKAEKSTIEAVNPDLSGKKLEVAYQQTVKGNQTVKPSGIFSEQSLSPSERAINLGKRLTSKETLTDGTTLDPVVLTDNPVKNLPVLRKALVDTESKLTSALNASPEITANKPALLKNFDKAKVEAPREFRIGPDKPIFDDVFDFANKVAEQADDSINGLREARSAFDMQAKTQYPNAFKEGAIDTKTAAGAAIKKARDIFNEHLYNTAPNGSDIQKLIGREADIFQATEPIAAKAAKGQGMTKVQKATKLIKEHPVSSVIGAGAAGYGVAKTIAP